MNAFLFITSIITASHLRAVQSDPGIPSANTYYPKGSHHKVNDSLYSVLLYMESLLYGMDIPTVLYHAVRMVIDDGENAYN